MLLASVAETVLTGGAARSLRAQAVALDREALHKEAERLRATGAEVEEELLSGMPDVEIATRAKQPGTYLVVVSSHGHSAPLRWILGSIAEKIAETSPIPTLVVRDAAPFETWLAGERPLKIFVGTDFTPNSDAALDWISKLREVAPCEVIAAYVAWTEAPVALEYPIPPELIHTFPDDEDEAQVRRRLEEKVNAALGEGSAQIDVVAGSGRVDARLVELAAEAHADLIVVGSHQWHGLDRLWHHSVSRGILHHARMNVACVPTPATAK